MIRSICPTCKGIILLPDPPPNTMEQNIAFRKAWDARVKELNPLNPRQEAT